MSDQGSGTRNEAGEHRAFDLRRLTRADWACAGSGFLLLLGMSLPWYTFESSRPVVGSPWAASEQSFSTGWESDASAVVLVTCLAAIAVAVVAALGRKVALPVSTGLVVAVLGALAFALVIGEALDPFEYWDVAVGLYASPLAAAAVAGAGWLSMRQEGTSVGAEWRRLQGRFGSRKPA